MNNNYKIIAWLNISIFFLIIMVVVGGITRLTDSGLSMVTWKPITGVLPPLNYIEWNNSFTEYKKFPEYKVNNQGMTLSEYKSIYMWEYLHRMLGRFFGFLFIVPFSIFFIKGYLDNKLTKHLLFIFLLGGFQGLIGWYMVKSGLINEPHVSHYRLALHLFIAFLILVYVYKLKISILFKKLNKINNYSFYNNFCSVIIFLLFIQVIFGAFNAGLKTVNTINTFPFYNGVIFPISKMSLDPFWLNFLENNFGVQLVHRYLAFIIVLMIGCFTYYLNSECDRIKIESRYAISLIIYQCILGVLTLVSGAALIFGIIHQLLAIILILTMVKIKHRLKYII
tara:strand:+ start:1355 stop:2368 length:1014 start_codon:yes stop_codon:yes gene_type:complete